MKKSIVKKLRNEFIKIYSRSPLLAMFNNKGELIRESEWRKFKKQYLNYGR